MEQSSINRLQAISSRKVNDVSLDFRRFLYGQIDWSQRLISIIGPRGVGKTTLLLQRLKDSLAEFPSSLYLSLDSIWLSARDIYGLVEHHVQYGGTHLFLDEVHYLENWQTLIKNLNDDFSRLHIAFTGSSMLRIEKNAGDLSRRMLRYDLPGLSFREYLAFEGIGVFEPLPLTELLANHVRYAQDICAKVGVILPHFNTYLQSGYYPFYKEAGPHFPDMLFNAVNQVLDSDYPRIDDVHPSTIDKARRMLKVLAVSTPQTPNVTVLCRELEIDRKQGIKMLYSLARAGLLNLLAAKADKLKNLATPEKILCGDTNIMNALSDSPDRGAIRETFFLNQLKTVAEVICPGSGDFLVNGKYLFEVGGAGKGFEQIKDIPDSYLAVDNLEIGHGARIPLWLFGFLY